MQYRNQMTGAQIKEIWKTSPITSSTPILFQGGGDMVRIGGWAMRSTSPGPQFADFQPSH
jgi:hypothetical protein